MLWLLIPLAVAFVLLVDTENRAWRALLESRARTASLIARIAALTHATSRRRRRARTLEWINSWRVAHRRAPLPELRKGVRGSRRHGILARNLDVLSYADGVWTDVSGGGGGVPAFVAQFAREFDDGHYPDLAGQLVRRSSRVAACGAAPGLAWAEPTIVA